jgi:hypothetical protein
MLFLLGQRAAKIALHDSQDRALVVGQTQPLGFAPGPYDPTGLALGGPVRRVDHFRARLRACLLHLRLGQAGQQPHAAQVALSEALRLERGASVKRLAEAAGNALASPDPLEAILGGLSPLSSAPAACSAIFVSARAISALCSSTIAVPMSRIRAQALR